MNGKQQKSTDYVKTLYFYLTSHYSKPITLCNKHF